MYCDNYICRAKCKDTGKWIYGYYVAVPIECGHGEISHAIFNPHQCKHVCMGEYRDYGWYNVDPKTVCRFTGLYDDTEKEIYENDVLIVDDEYKAIALWSEESAAFIVNYLDGDHNGGWDYLSNCICEVIGNDIDDGMLFEATEMWRITFFERHELNPLHGILPNYGGVNMQEYYSTYDAAFKALHEINNDPYKSACDYAILEKIDEDLAIVVAYTQWFEYDHVRDGYFAIEAPIGHELFRKWNNNVR